MLGFDSKKLIRRNVPLRGFTTYKIGGITDSLIEVYDTPSLIRTVLDAKDDLLILGRGSNVLVSDNGFRGQSIIVRTNKVTISGTRVFAEAGVSLSALANRTIELGLFGLAFAVGIPGSVGGACIMNAGAFGGSISDVLVSVDVLRDGKNVTLSKSQCGLGYRSSEFLKGDIILSAVFELKEYNKDELLALKKQYMLFRKNTQPQGYSAGSVFKKADKPAGFYIDSAGLKGFSIKDACVSSLHANFIINKGNASAYDVASLIDTIKAKVKIEFDVKLKEEIKYIGF